MAGHLAIPGHAGEDVKHSVPAGDIGGLLVRLRSLQERVRAREAVTSAGRHPGGRARGFWIHRVLTENGIGGHVVDPASVATSRCGGGVQADKLDGDTLVRTLLAYKCQ